MLIEFRVKNFKSFKELNKFTLVKGKQRFFEERIGHVDKLSVLKFSGIFGANASGKSNLVRAIKIMQFIVTHNSVPIDAMNEYFKLSSECENKPTYFEVLISIGEDIYTYGFEVNLKTWKIETEWLFKLHYKTDKTINETKIFDRLNGEIEFSSEKDADDRLKVYREDVKLFQNNLFLSHVGRNGFLVDKTNKIMKEILNVYNWFLTSLSVLYSGEPFVTPEFVHNLNTEEISKLLSSLDTGIKYVELQEVDEIDFKKDFYTTGTTLNDILRTFESQRFILNNGRKLTPTALLRTPNDYWVIKYNDNKLSFSRLVFYHDVDKRVPFMLGNESDGTLRLFELSGALLNKENDRTLIVDELDRCLHPMLTVEFVKLFLKKASNEQDRSQLIVTTHESHLLDLDLLRRDEIWFVVKKEGESSIYSLETYNVRFDKIIDKAYFEGRFDGVPVFESAFFPENVIYENK